MRVLNTTLLSVLTRATITQRIDNTKSLLLHVFVNCTLRTVRNTWVHSVSEYLYDVPKTNM